MARKVSGPHTPLVSPLFGLQTPARTWSDSTFSHPYLSTFNLFLHAQPREAFGAGWEAILHHTRLTVRFDQKKKIDFYFFRKNLPPIDFSVVEHTVAICH